MADGLPLPAAGTRRQVIPGQRPRGVVIAVEAADQVDAEGELLVHVAADAEQHGEAEQVVGGVAGTMSVTRRIWDSEIAEPPQQPS